MKKTKRIRRNTGSTAIQAIAYLVLMDISEGKYWPASYKEWAAERMKGENRTGGELVREALKEVGIVVDLP